MAVSLEFSSKLPAARADVWSEVSTMRGVNYELGPWIKMSHPAEAESLADLDLLEPGAVLFHSWLLFLGVVPFDRHALALVEVIDCEGFVEESTSWLQRRWRHERRLTSPSPDTCVVTDRLIVEPRIGFVTPIVRRIVGATFRHRHRRLRARFARP